jgi:S-formylglutathione hydrolase FrmB
MPWSETRLSGHRCDLFEPESYNPHNFALIYLHGLHLHRLIDKPAFTAQFEKYGLPVVAPFTGPSWWSDRICPGFDPQMTAERYVIDSVVPFLAERFDARPPTIGLLGTSMGGQGALRFAFKYPSRFPVVAAISPAIDYQLRWHEGDAALPQMYSDPEDVRQDTAILHVHPLNWPRNTWFSCDPADERWYESAERLHMKLAALGIPHEFETETTVRGPEVLPAVEAHSFAYYNQVAGKAIAFLAQRLEKERLRMP